MCINSYLHWLLQSDTYVQYVCVFTNQNLNCCLTIFIGLTCIHIYVYLCLPIWHVDRCKDMGNKYLHALSYCAPLCKCKLSVTTDFPLNLSSIWMSQRKGHRLEGIVQDSGECFTFPFLRANKTYNAGMFLKHPYFLLCPSALWFPGCC